MEYEVGKALETINGKLDYLIQTIQQEEEPQRKMEAAPVQRGRSIPDESEEEEMQEEEAEEVKPITATPTPAPKKKKWMSFKK